MEKNTFDHKKRKEGKERVARSRVPNQSRLYFIGGVGLNRRLFFFDVSVEQERRRVPKEREGGPGSISRARTSAVP